MESLVRQHTAQTILETRERMGLTQKELADHAGINKGQVSRIESAAQSVTSITLMRLAEALDIPVESLFPGGRPYWHCTDCEEPDTLAPVYEHAVLSAVHATVYRPTYFPLTSVKRNEYWQRHELYSRHLDDWWSNLRLKIKQETVRRLAPAIRIEYRIFPAKWYAKLLQVNPTFFKSRLSFIKSSDTIAFITLHDDLYGPLESRLQQYVRGRSWESVSLCDRTFQYATNDDHTLDYCWHKRLANDMRATIMELVSVEDVNFCLDPLEDEEQLKKIVEKTNQNTLRHIDRVQHRRNR